MSEEAAALAVSVAMLRLRSNKDGKRGSNISKRGNSTNMGKQYQRQNNVVKTQMLVSQTLPETLLWTWCERAGLCFRACFMYVWVAVCDGCARGRHEHLQGTHTVHTRLLQRWPLTVSSAGGDVLHAVVTTSVLRGRQAKRVADIGYGHR